MGTEPAVLEKNTAKAAMIRPEGEAEMRSGHGRWPEREAEREILGLFNENSEARTEA